MIYFPSLRQKLASVSTIVFLLILFIVSMINYFSNVNLIKKSIDEHLLIEADEMAYTLQYKNDSLLISYSREWTEPEHLLGSDYPIFVEIMQHNEITHKTDNLQDNSLPWPKTKNQFYNANFHSYNIRGITKPIQDNDEIIGYINAAITMKRVTEYKKSFLATLIPVLIFGLLLSYFGGLYISQKSLRPFGNITQQLNSIKGENLKTRILTDCKDEEISNMVKQINGLLNRLEQSFKSVKQFSANASHELKTPLAIIKSEISSVLTSDDKEHIKESVDSISEEIRYLEDITQTLTNLALLESSQSPIVEEKVWMNDLVFDTITHFQTNIAQKGLQLSLTEVDSIEFSGDKQWLKMLIRNILDNAIKYNYENGFIEIILKQIDNNIKLIIRDDGPGVIEEEIPILSKRFYRSDQNVSPKTGVGLGLAICSKIVEYHNGSITFANANPGFIVTITLPNQSND